MRPLEILAAVGVLAWLLRPGWLAVAAPLAAVLQAVAEGPRWQMAPVYLGAALALAAGLASLADRGTLRLTCGALALALAGCGAALASTWPVFSLPPPTGAQPVGTLRMRLPGPRPLAVRVWYPAEPRPGLKRAPYGNGGGRFFGYQRLVSTDALLDAPVAPGRHAVILYAHGWGGFAAENTALLSDLASHGYVAVAVEAPDGLGTWRAPDGHAVNLDGPLDLTSDAAAAETMLRADHNVVLRAGNLRRALDGVAADPRFAGRLETDHVGALGFSFGGAVVAEASREDRRIAAVMNMDGWLFGPAQRDGVPVPYLAMSDDEPLPPPEAVHSPDASTRNSAIWMARDWKLMRAHFAASGGDYLTLTGSLHQNFSDRPMQSWWRHWGGGGPIRPRRAQAVVREVAQAFFGRWLRGEGPGALAGTKSAWPEIRRESWPIPRQAALTDQAR